MKQAVSIIQFAVLALALGCSTLNKSAITATTVIDAAMQAWGQCVREGGATPEEQAKVRAAYVDYQTSAKVVLNTAKAFKAHQGTEDSLSVALHVLAESSSSLITLITTLLPLDKSVNLHNP